MRSLKWGKGGGTGVFFSGQVVCMIEEAKLLGLILYRSEFILNGKLEV